MPNDREKEALSKIKAYLDDGRSMDEIREVGWELWIDDLKAKGYDLRTGRLALHPPKDAPGETAQTLPDVSAESVANAPTCAKCGSYRDGSRPYCGKCGAKFPDGAPPRGGRLELRHPSDVPTTDAMSASAERKKPGAFRSAPRTPNGGRSDL